MGEKIELTETQKELKRLLRKCRFVHIYCRYNSESMRSIQTTKVNITSALLREPMDIAPGSFTMEKGVLRIGEVWS